MNAFQTHQYIERKTGRVVTETPLADPVIQTVYSTVRERAPFAFNLLLSRQFSAILGFLNYDFPLLRQTTDPLRLCRQMGINMEELAEPVSWYHSYRRLFERQIRYWKCRPMSEDPAEIVSPADSRAITGSFRQEGALMIKEKWFEYSELIGEDKPQWLAAFQKGDFAIFRLTPDKYHYNHCPVAGTVKEIYDIKGLYHSCNPGAVVEAVTPHSKNQRVVTIIDTDVPGGSGVGLVAMIEIVALMIGRIVQSYSAHRYDSPQPIKTGLFLKKGGPKSLFQPGSSSVVLIFQQNRIRFHQDLLANACRPDVQSRFSHGFGTPLVETDLQVRETIGARI